MYKKKERKKRKRNYITKFLHSLTTLGLFFGALWDFCFLSPKHYSVPTDRQGQKSLNFKVAIELTDSSTPPFFNRRGKAILVS